MSESTFSVAMQQLMDPERAPDVIKITHNGTETVLVKTKDPERGFVYVGVPTSGSQTCRYGMQLDSTCFVRGTAALNFITKGGWKRNQGVPTQTEKAEARGEFIRTFLSAAIVHQGMDNFNELKSFVEVEECLTVKEGKMSDETRETLGAIGMRSWLCDVAESRGLTFEVDVPKFISRFVQPTYAICEKGDFDGESREVSVTSNLLEAHVSLMKRNGLRFKKVVGRRKASSSK